MRRLFLRYCDVGRDAPLLLLLHDGAGWRSEVGFLLIFNLIFR